MAREIDVRTNSPVAKAALDAFGGAYPPGRINSLTGSPTLVRVPGGGAPMAGLEGEPSSLIRAALAAVQGAPEAFGLEVGEPAEFVPDPTVQRTSGGSSVVHLHQQFRGIPIFQMARSVRFGPDNRMMDATGDSAAIDADVNTSPVLNVSDAVRRGADYVAEPDKDRRTDHWGQELQQPALSVKNYAAGVLASFPMPSRPTVLEKGPFEQLVPAHLVLFYQGDRVRLCWHALYTFPGFHDQYAVILAADKRDGEVLYCKATIPSARGRGSVYVEAPGRTPRTDVTFPLPVSDYPIAPPAPLPNFPPDWCEADLCHGNAVIASLGNSTKTYRGTVNSGNVVFTPAVLDGDDQKVLNIFYFCNYMHDFFYMLGFDEAAGNFQELNLSGNGLPGDAVRARAHSGAVYGTANMATRPDGRPPIMNMGMVTSTNRHTAFDADVVFHEFTHGVTNRLVGGRMNSSALDEPQSAGMGEGWSDYFALTIQNFGKPTERVVTGDWVVGKKEGIRGYPYNDSFPDNFGHIGTGRYTEEHNVGEIWCAALMAMTREVRKAIDDAPGYHVCWQAVVDGLKLTAANPSFLDARDAILRAIDDMHTSGRLSPTDHKSVKKAAWKAFAKFGMGPAAFSNGASLYGCVEDFTEP